MYPLLSSRQCSIFDTVHAIFTPLPMEEPDTKGARRERKRNSRRKMRVTGASVRLLLDIVRRQAARVTKHHNLES